MKFKPHQCQIEGIKYAYIQQRCLLFFDMGLGKTVIILTLITMLLEQKKVSRVLIVAPKAVAQNVWHTEAIKWDHTKKLTIDVCVGKDWSDADSSTANIVVINKENVPKIDLKRYDMLVIDEVSCIKDPSTKLFKHIKRYSFEYFVGLTGTPLTAGLEYIWSMMYPVDQGMRLGRTNYEFKNRYFYNINKYKWLPKNNAMLLITKAIKDKILIKHVKGNIPVNEIVYMNYEVELQPKLRLMHDSVVKHLVLFDDKGAPLKLMPNTASSLNSALQVCNGCVYIYENDTHYRSVHNIKANALNDILETCDDNVLIAYHFKFDRELISGSLLNGYNGLNKDTVRFIESPKDIDDWNARKIKVGIAHPKSLGKGVNLQQGGSIIIWYGLTWSLEDYEQFNARLARQGQTKPVRVVHLMIKDSVEQQVLRRLNFNRGTQSEFKKLLTG